VKARRAAVLALRNLKRDRRGSVLGALGVATGVGCLVFFTALGTGVARTVRTRVFPDDATRIEVVPPQVSLGALLGGGKLDEEQMGRLAALPGVEAVLPKMAIRVSGLAYYDGPFFGRPLRIGVEVMGVGVAPALMAQDAAPGHPFADPGPGKPLPVIVSSRLLELYNKSFAAQRGLPKLTRELLVGFRFPVQFGNSFVVNTGSHPEQQVIEVVGFSDHALLGGITVPLDVARRLHRTQGLDADTYSAAVLRARTPDAVPEIIAAVRRMGFELDDSERTLAEQIGWAIALVTGALGLLSILITALAAVNIAHAFYASVRERRREIGVLRAIGASADDVERVLLLEAAAVGLAGGAVGLLLGRAGAALADLAAARVLPDFPFKPGTFFAWPAPLLAAGLAVAVLAAIVGALPPAREAARNDPAASLSE